MAEERRSHDGRGAKAAKSVSNESLGVNRDPRQQIPGHTSPARFDARTHLHPRNLRRHCGRQPSVAMAVFPAAELRDGLQVWDTPDMADSSMRSRRLALRPLRAEDATHLVALLGDDRDAVLQMSHMPWPCTPAAAREWIALRTQPGAATFAITRVDDEAFLGAIGFGGLREMPTVGYWIGRRYWDDGYATEALQLVIAHVRGLGAKGLQAETFPENPASARVLAKCGFRERGTVRRNYPGRGGLVPVRMHILHFATHDAGSAADFGEESPAR